LREEDFTGAEEATDSAKLVSDILDEPEMDLQSKFCPASIHGEKEVVFWRDVLQAPEWVMDVLTQGYVLPFERFPDEAYEEQNNKSAKQDMEFVRETIHKWEKEGVVEVVASKPMVVSPLTVVSRTMPDGTIKKRLCFDGSRYVNPRLKKEKVNLAHLQKALEITEQGDWQAKYDLTNAYFHIKICQEHRKFLGASFEKVDGSKEYFQFNVLPFGLSTAVQAMTKMTKPLQAFVNKKGIRHSIYIDDGRVVAETKEKAQEDYKQVLSILSAAGWQIAHKKSDNPADVSQQKHFLGFCIDSKEMTVALSQEKKEQIQQLARQVESSEDRFLRAKDLASFIGKVAAAEPALGSIVPITTRRAYQDLDEVVRQFGWSGKVKISAEVAEDFGRFRQRIDEFNGTPIRTQATEIAVVSIIGEPSEFIKQKFIKNHKRQKEMEIWAGDASATAVCAFSVSGEQPFFFKRRLTSEEQKKSSGMRELLTVRYVLQDMEEEASGLNNSRTIYWLTDSENLV